MNLRVAIKHLKNAAERLRRPSLAEQPKLERTNKVLEQIYLMGGTPPDPEELLVVAARISSQVHSSNAVARKDWRQAPWCLWSKEYPLAHDDVVRDAYLGWLRLKPRWSHNGLVSSYLRDFDPDDSSFHRIGEELADAAVKFNTHWCERHRRFALFSPWNAPTRIAKAVLAESKPVREVLEEVGLTGELVHSGLGAAAFRTSLEVYKEQIKSSDDPLNFFNKVTNWAVLGNELQFGSLRAGIATCLLMPWVHGNPTSSNDLADMTRDFLLTHFKDPRLHPALWNGVDDDALAVMKRWLARASLEQFFQIVDDVASPEFRLQWPYRRPFWNAYEKIDAITDAWVAFADKGASRAKQVFEGKLPFGRLHRTGNVQANQAILLLKVGSLTIAEWSENGKCFIWLSGNDNAPILYQKWYKRDDVTIGADNGGIVHGGASHGTWQRRVANWIGQHTNIRVSPTDYMPKGRR